MDNKEIRIKTDAGTILVYANQRDQNAGIMLIPDGGDDEIEIAYVECVDDDGENAQSTAHLALTNIYGAIYENALNEHATHDFTIGSDEIQKRISLLNQESNDWSKYLEYLRAWVDTHSETAFCGCSPACFNEWLDNENNED